MQTSKLIKRICAVASFIILFVAVECILGKALETVSYSFYFNHEMDMLEENEEQADMIFIGASRVYRTFIPEIFEEKLGLNNVINASTSAQPIEASYYQLKELVPRFKPKYVVLGVTWNGLGSGNGDKALQKWLIVKDRLHGITKAEFVLKEFELNEWPYLLNTYRFRNNLNIRVLQENEEEKRMIVENNYQPVEVEEEYYADTGFVYNYTSIPNGNMEMTGTTSFSEEERIDKQRLSYLYKIIDLCKENEIELFLVTSPTTMMRTYSVDNYEGAVQFYKELARENNLTYHNLNYIKDREIILPDSMMADYNHTNGEGAKIVSNIYANILKDTFEGKDTKHYLYETLDELKTDVNRVVAVSAEMESEEDIVQITISSLQNEDVSPLYQLLVSANEEEWTIVKDWTTENCFEINVGQYQDGCSFMVKAKIGVEDEVEAYQIYRYN